MDSKKKYFYSNNDEKKGPFNFDELRNEDILPDTLIWFEGLDDWKVAKELKEMSSILELVPPPIPKTELNICRSCGEETHSASYCTNCSKRYNLSDSSSKIKPKKQLADNGEFKKASTGWLVFGFIFSFLGGLIGLGMGFHYAFGKYDKNTKTTGWIMVVISFIFMSIWKLVARI